MPVIPSECNRVCRSKRASRRSPPGLRPGHFDIWARGHPAEFCEVRVLRPGGRQQLDLGALAIDCFMVVGECQVIEFCTQQVDRAMQPGRRDHKARLLGESGLTRFEGVRRRGARGGGRSSIPGSRSARGIGRSRGRGRRWLRRRSGRRGRGNRRSGGRRRRLHRPHALERELEGDQNPDREDDRDEKITLFHVVAVIFGIARRGLIAGTGGLPIKITGLGDRIVAAAAPGMAARQTPEREEDAAPGAV